MAQATGALCIVSQPSTKILDEGMAGDNAGLLLRGIKREDVERGQVVIKPGTNTPHASFEAQVYILGKDEGGRHTPFFNNYRPQFYFRTTDVTDRKSTRLNSSHLGISYAVFCLKKQK